MDEDNKIITDADYAEMGLPTDDEIDYMAQVSPLTAHRYHIELFIKAAEWMRERAVEAIRMERKRETQ